MEDLNELRAVGIQIIWKNPISSVQLLNNTYMSYDVWPKFGSAFFSQWMDHILHWQQYVKIAQEGTPDRDDRKYL